MMKLLQPKLKYTRLVVLSLTVLAFSAVAYAEGGYGTVNLTSGRAIAPLTGTVLGDPAAVTDSALDNFWYSMDWDSSAGVYTNAFTIDLGAAYPIGKINVYTKQTAGFKIWSSTDGSTWTERHSYDWTTGLRTPDLMVPVTLLPDGAYSARYLKYEGWAWWIQYVGVAEFQVYEWLASAPPDPSLAGLSNLALGKPAWGYLPALGYGPADSLTDGNNATYWQGNYAVDNCANVGSWCQNTWYNIFGFAYVDLGASQPIQAIRLTFPSGAPGSQTYVVNLTDTASGTPSKWAAFGGDPAMVASFPVQTSSATRTFFLTAPVSARYVWIQIVNWVTPGTPPPGLAEIEVFGELPPPPATYTITASAGAGGGISPSGAVSVNSGGGQNFAITANAGYHVADVLVDGASVGAVGSYTFNSVTANHTIAASFAIDTFTITASAGAGGGISPSGVVSVNSGDSQNFIITPNAGYQVGDVIVDGVSFGVLASYSFAKVMANHTIAASFAVAANPPRTKHDCKNGGWQTHTTASGKPFKNQGQCIDYVNDKNDRDDRDDKKDKDDH